MFDIFDQFITTVALRYLDPVFLLKDHKNTDDPRSGAPGKGSRIGVASSFARVDTLHTPMKDGKIKVNIPDVQQSPITLLIFDHGVMVSTIPDEIPAHKYLVHPCLGGEVISWT